MVVSYNIVTLFVPQVDGIKGFALILTLQHHSLIPGYVIGYMHGTLLGVTKTLLMLWFSPSKHNKGKDFFIGDQVCLNFNFNKVRYMYLFHVLK